ncbi:ABC transporter ATP-binding protein [Thermophilibacter provencensis]|uniref:ATP-binding cassette domain-containing protein n=1 Tax=Thermophilibacter provencensis TaxID=1852386 RepID=A0ABT7V6R1_9ACTN|nr:ATP-binding cassette domain-containing protein [Thermophilibacter provencensis]MDM8271701.1 ATP-binding cassette domain-containing protein [Thermophilibacter provencensis]
MATYALETSSLSKSFSHGTVHAVRNVSLAVPAGSVFGIVGKNGAGKSTLLKLVAGFMRQDAGTVSVLGRQLRPGESDPRIGALVEAPAVYGKLDAFENLMNRALVLGLPDPKKACREALELVGLDARTAGDGSRRVLWPRGTYVDDLSTGQRQRLGVALALIGNPELLLLDEPLSGIDPTGVSLLRDLLVRLNRERGVTIVVSSHVLADLGRMCTHYGIMRDGALVRQLTSEELADACATYLTLRVDAPERAVAVLAEELPGLTVRVLPGGSLRVTAPGGGEPDRTVLAQVLLAAGIAVTELTASAPDVEAELVRIIDGKADAAGRRTAKKGR